MEKGISYAQNTAREIGAYILKLGEKIDEKERQFLHNLEGMLKNSVANAARKLFLEQSVKYDRIANERVHKYAANCREMIRQTRDHALFLEYIESMPENMPELSEN